MTRRLVQGVLPRVDLAYLQTGINGVFLGVLNFKNLYFYSTGHSCCIFIVLVTAAVFFGFLNKSCILKCFMFSTVGSSFYSPSASIIMGLHYYHIMLDFCEMNSVLRVFFRVLLFIFLAVSVSGKVFFGSFRNTQLR